MGILWVFVVLLLNLFAASPSLHQLVHAGANNPDHQCAITLFAHGQVDVAATDAAVSRPAEIIVLLPQYSLPLLAAPAALLPPGRAPPVIPSPC